MSKQVKETGKKKGLIQIAIIAGIGGLIGGAGSALFSHFAEPLSGIMKNITGNISRYSVLLLIATAVTACVLSTALVLRAGYRYKKWDGEDEIWAEKLEKSITRYQTILTFFAILCVCLSGIVIAPLHHKVVSNNSVIALFAFSVAIFWSLFCIDRIIRYDKKMNPEKRGNYLSWSFNKEWLASCDEREKVKLFQAAYHTHEASQYVYMVIFSFLLLVSVIKDIGVLPFLMLAVIWCSQILMNLYYYERKTRE